MMLAHLRRSIISIVVFTVFFGFVYAFAGTGVAQLLFKHQADGSITANGSTLIGQNWSQTQVPGAPARQLRVPGPSRRPRPLRRLSPKHGRPAGTTRSRPTTSSATRSPERGRVRGHQPRAPFQDALENTRDLGRPTGTRGASTPRPIS